MIRPSPPWLFGGVSAILLMLLGLEWMLPAGNVAPDAPLQNLQFERASTPPPRDTAAWEDVILARPLFSVSRRPPPASIGKDGAAAPGQARLSGIMIAPGARRAIFVPAGETKPLVLAVGDRVGQSTIRFILPDRVIMADGTILRPTLDAGDAQSAPSFPPVMFRPQNMPPGMPAFPNPMLRPLPHQGNSDALPGQGGNGQVVGPAGFRGTLVPPRSE